MTLRSFLSLHSRQIDGSGSWLHSQSFEPATARCGNIEGDLKLTCCRNSFLGAIRTKTSLPTSVRETAIARVAVLNKAWYEWESHSPILRAAEGITPEHVDAVLQSPPHQVNKGIQDAKLAAVLSYTDAMTLNVSVPDEVFANLKQQYSEQEVVEITATVAAYNCVSRFLVALDVGETNGQKGPEKEWEL